MRAESICSTKIPPYTANEQVMYYDFIMEKAMEDCFLLHHEIAPPPNMIDLPDVDLYSFLLLAQSTSPKLVRHRSLP